MPEPGDGHDLAGGGADHDRRDAGEVHFVGVQHRERDAGAAARIDRVAAALKHRKPGGRGEIVTGGNRVPAAGESGSHARFSESQPAMPPRLFAPAPPSSWSSRHRRAGESGNSRTSTPSGPSAAATALAAVAATATMPPSPAPLAPSGLVRERRSSNVTARTLGKSEANGSR